MFILHTAYRVLKENEEGEPTATDCPPYETRPVQQTPRGYVYVPLSNQQQVVRKA